MRRVRLLVALLAAHPAAAQAEIYRCVGVDGSVRFVGDPSTCAQAGRQELTREIQRFGDDRKQASPGAPNLTGEASPGAPNLTGEASPEEVEGGAPAAAAHVHDPLENLFLPAPGGSGVWEVVKEAAVDPADDADFLRWGVREKQVRHYTHRDDAGRVRVCSVELWAFQSEGQARLAQESLSFPNWRFQRRGPVLVMLHGVSRERGARAEHGVFPECSRLGARIAARAGNLSR